MENGTIQPYFGSVILTNKEPIISIVTPSLNQAAYLEGSILSILKQDYPSIEHIIIDGGSTDGSIDIIRKYEKNLAFWSSEKDGGTSEAINKGWGKATGDFLWILNADDRIQIPDTLSALANCLIENPDVDFVYGDMVMIDGNGKVFGRRAFRDYDITSFLMDRRHLPFPGCLMRRRVIEKIGGFTQRLKYSNDLDFFLRLARGFKMKHLKKDTGVFRIHDAASTQSNIFDSGSETITVCENFLKTIPDWELSRPKDHIWASFYLFGAGFSFNAGRSSMTRRYLRKAIEKKPSLALNPKLYIYFLLSVFGDKATFFFSSLFRKLIRKNAFYYLNNLLSRQL